MRDALKAYLSLAGSLTEVTRQRAAAAARALVAQGEATAEQVTSLAEDLVEQSRANREAVSALVKFEVDRTLGRVGLASGDEVAELSARVRVLEASLRELSGRLAAVETGDAEGAARPSGTGRTAAGPAGRKTSAAGRKTSAARATAAEATTDAALAAPVAPSDAAPTS